MDKEEISIIKLPLGDGGSTENLQNYHFYQQPYQSINLQNIAPLPNSEIPISEPIFPNINLNARENEKKEQVDTTKGEKESGRKKPNRRKKSLDLNKALVEFQKIQANYFITIYLLIMSAAFIISGVILYDSVIKTTADNLKMLIELSIFLSILTGICTIVSIIKFFRRFIWFKLVEILSLVSLPVFFFTLLYGFANEQPLAAKSAQLSEKCNESYKILLNTKVFLLIVDVVFIISINLVKDIRRFMHGSKDI